MNHNDKASAISAGKSAALDHARFGLVEALLMTDLPAGLHLRSGDLLTVEAASKGAPGLEAKHYQERRSAPSKVDANEISLLELISLLDHGARGPELRAATGSSPLDSRMGKYRARRSRIKHTDIMKQDQVLVTYSASVENENGILGKIYKECVADGYAYHMVTQLRPNQPRLMVLPVCDCYTSLRISDDGWVDSVALTRTIEFERAFDEMIRSPRPRP